MKSICFQILLLLFPLLAESQAIVEFYFPEDNYEIVRDTTLGTDIDLSWKEKTIPGSYIYFDYEHQNKIHREFHRDIELTFYLNKDSVLSVRKEMFQDSAGFDFQSFFLLSEVENIRFSNEYQEILISFHIGKPFTDYLFYVDLYISKKATFRYKLRKPEYDDGW